MPALSLPPALSFLTSLSRMSPARPLRTFIRSTTYKIRPPRPLAHVAKITTAQDALLATGAALPAGRANILHEASRGQRPTIVIGGFVPDATEQVYLLRDYLLKKGSIYYFNYPRADFSLELLYAQLDDLVAEIAQEHGQPPVILSVSFGVGLVMDWLQRKHHRAQTIELGGLLLISPVACVEDLIDPSEPKPSTLLGRAVKPYLDATSATSTGIEKSRAIFTKMFEAGAQNKDAIRGLLTKGELARLRTAVLGAIQGITADGARERVQALKQMTPPTAYFSKTMLPLSTAPTAIFYAEKESSVLTEKSPTRFALESAHRAYFPFSTFKVVTNDASSPVQHASLIFHYGNFKPLIAQFYRDIKKARLPAAI